MRRGAFNIESGFALKAEDWNDEYQVSGVGFQVSEAPLITIQRIPTPET
jgi:hypothetical protein